MRSVTVLALAGSLAALPRPLLAQKAADPDSLLTAQDVSGVLGIKSLPGRPWLGTSKASCFYSADTTFDLEARTATLMILAPGAFDSQKAMPGNGPLAGKSPGVGDDSYYMSYGHCAKLGVRKGDSPSRSRRARAPARPTRWPGWRRRWRRRRWRSCEAQGAGAEGSQGRRVRWMSYLAPSSLALLRMTSTRPCALRSSGLVRLGDEHPEEEVDQDPRKCGRHDRSHHVDHPQQGRVDSEALGQTAHHAGDHPVRPRAPQGARQVGHHGLRQCARRGMARRS
jgi:hypothetical protein